MHAAPPQTSDQAPDRACASDQHSAPSPRHVFVDCGSNTCKVLEDRIALGLETEFFAFEPQPELSHCAAEAQARHPEVSITFEPKAVWTEDGGRDFFLATHWGENHRGGSTLVDGHVKNAARVDYGAPVAVRTVGLSAWLARNFEPTDHVTLKMDIEGAEYPVLEQMVADGTIDLIDELIVEFHWTMSTTVEEARHDRLVEALQTRTTLSLWR